jgi:hypothetical protein
MSTPKNAIPGIVNSENHVAGCEGVLGKFHSEPPSRFTPLDHPANVRITINRIVSAPMRTPPDVFSESHPNRKPAHQCDQPKRFAECHKNPTGRIIKRPTYRSGRSPNASDGLGLALAIARVHHAARRCGGRAAESQHEHAPLHSITSLARATSVDGISTPSALAVLRLMSSSKRVGCSMGRSAGLAPLIILSTYTAARRHR